MDALRAFAVRGVILEEEEAEGGVIFRCPQADDMKKKRVALLLVAAALLAALVCLRVGLFRYRLYRRRMLAPLPGPPGAASVRRGPRILVLQYDDRPDELLGHQVDLCRLNAAYADRHGYTYIFHRERVGGMPPYWAKVWLVQHHLEGGHYDLVCWVDTDAAFHRGSWAIEDVVSPFPSRSFFGGDDPPNVHTSSFNAEFNAGIFFERRHLPPRDCRVVQVEVQHLLPQGGVAPKGQGLDRRRTGRRAPAWTPGAPDHPAGARDPDAHRARDAGEREPLLPHTERVLLPALAGGLGRCPPQARRLPLRGRGASGAGRPAAAFSLSRNSSRIDSSSLSRCARQRPSAGPGRGRGRGGRRGRGRSLCGRRIFLGRLLD
eukprot:tig00000681_g3113.t1